MEKTVAIIGTRGYPSFYGGFETLIRRLAPYLAHHQWDVLVYGRPGAVKQGTGDSLNGIRTKTTRGLETKSLSTLSYGLSATLDSILHKPTVALIMNVANGYWLPLLKLRGIPTIVNVDGIEWEREKWNKVAKTAFRIGARLTARYADSLIFDSKEIERRWNVEFRRTGTFIPYGGDEPEALPAPAEFGGDKYVLIVARFVPENTVGEFLEAANRLAEKWNVAIVGTTGYGGELDDRAQALADARSNVHWYRHISDDAQLFALWQHAGAYFHGHSVGGTNPALVQSMSCGAPTVARDTVYNREVLGDAAIFTQPTPDEIYMNVDYLMSNREVAQKMGNDLRRRALKHYTWQTVCADYMKTIETQLERKKRATSKLSRIHRRK